MAEKAVLVVFLNLLLRDSRASASGPLPDLFSFHLESEIEVCCYWLSLGSENPSGVCPASLSNTIIPTPESLPFQHPESGCRDEAEASLAFSQFFRPLWG